MTPNFFKKPRYYFSVCFFIIGIFSSISAISTDKSGIIGKLFHETFLSPFFGSSGWIFSLYLLFLAVVLAIFKKPLKSIISLTLILLVILVRSDNSFSFDETFSNVNIGRYLNITGIQYIGPYGMIVVEFLMLLISGLLFYTYRFQDNERSTSSKTSSPGKPAKNKNDGSEAASNSKSEKTPESMKIDSTTKAESDSENTVLLNFDQKHHKYSRPSIKNLSKFNPAKLSGTCKHQDKIVKAFKSFGVSITVGKSIYGPFSERYEIMLEPGAKRKDIDRLVKEGDLSIALGIKNLRISEDTEAKLYLELPHQKKPLIHFNDLLKEFSETAIKEKYRIPMLFGVNANFQTVVSDLAQLPHLLIAGTTGSGKSVLVKSIITSLMYGTSPNNTKIILVDPKFVEFSIFEKSPFLACDVITTVEESTSMIIKLIGEMENRYRLLKSKSVHSLAAYNEQVPEPKQLPSVVLIIDEFADLMMMKKSNISDHIIRIAQKGRAAGIHLILATQRPSVNVINGLIKANVPGRAALKVASDVDSRTILDKAGADKLTGHGHMILIADKEQEVQSAFISDDEIKNIVAG